MKYYARTYIGVDYQGRFGKKVYVPTTEYVKTNSIEKYNKGKRYKFEESDAAKKYLRHLEKDTVYTEHEKLSGREVYWRPNISRR